MLFEMIRKIIGIKVKQERHHCLLAGEICSIMKFRILFRDFRCSTAKRLERFKVYIKEKEIMVLEEKKKKREDILITQRACARETKLARSETKIPPPDLGHSSCCWSKKFELSFCLAEKCV
jgi:hypothetical protein